MTEGTAWRDAELDGLIAELRDTHRTTSMSRCCDDPLNPGCRC